MWVPVVDGWFYPISPLAAAAAGLNAVERDGQLQILWDGSAPDVKHCVSATLLITDGAAPRSLPLDAVQLQSGTMNYARQSERVDVTLSLIQPNGQRRLQATTFIGKLPFAATPPASAAEPIDDLRKERDQLAADNARLKEALARQTDTNQRLQKLLDQLRVEHQREEQRRRLENQAK